MMLYPDAKIMIFAKAPEAGKSIYQPRFVPASFVPGRTDANVFGCDAKVARGQPIVR